MASAAASPYPSPTSPESHAAGGGATAANAGPRNPPPAPPRPTARKKVPIPPDGTCVGTGARFRLEKTIGQGTYGKVKLATDLKAEGPDNKVAVKIIDKSHISSPRQRMRLEREVSLLKLLHHPHIVGVHDVHETPDHIYIAMEYVGGGELFDYIVANKRVKENEARNFFRQVLSAVEYCHRNHIIHRDLKPENLLLQISPSPGGGEPVKTIKIIDFGFGNSFKGPGSGHLLDTFCGSPFYAAPEMILGRKYEGPEVDMWSLGVILFALLCGHLPFDDDNMKELYRKIAQGSYTVPDYLMPDARHLISRLITVDPSRRATLPEVLSHPWVNHGYSHPVPDYSPPRPPIAALEEGLVRRMACLNYGEGEVRAAFEKGGKAAAAGGEAADGDRWRLREPWGSPGEADAEDPHGAPLRCTYYLLKEMVAREEQRMRAREQAAAPAEAAQGKLPPLPAKNARVHAAGHSESFSVQPRPPPAVPERPKTPQGRYSTQAAMMQVDRAARTAPAYQPAKYATVGGTGAASRIPTSPVKASRTDPYGGAWAVAGSAAPGSAAVSAAGTPIAAEGSQAAASPSKDSTSGPGATTASTQTLASAAPASPVKAAPIAEPARAALAAPAPPPAAMLAPPSKQQRTSSSPSLKPPAITTNLPTAPGSPTKAAPTSAPVAAASPPASPTRRPLSSWFSTSVYQSRLPPEKIAAELRRVLQLHGIPHRRTEDGFECDIPDVQVVLENLRRPSSASSVEGSEGTLPASPSSSVGSVRPPSPAKRIAAALKGREALCFTVGIAPAPRGSGGGHVLHTRRVAGGNWNYRKIAGKVLDALVL